MHSLTCDLNVSLIQTIVIGVEQNMSYEYFILKVFMESIILKRIIEPDLKSVKFCCQPQKIFN